MITLVKGQALTSLFDEQATGPKALVSSTQMETGLIREMLCNPLRSVSLATFLQQIEAVEVCFRVFGLGHLVGDPGLPGRLRGAFGKVLSESASDSALSGLPCSFSPPSTFEVLFRKQGRMTPDAEFPSPWLIKVDPYDADLLVRLSLFGFATEWLAAASDAMATALRRPDWIGQSCSSRNVQITARDVVSVGVSGAADEVACDLVIETLSPVVLSGASALERPASLFTTLSKRIEGMARWQRTTVDADWVKMGRTLRRLTWEWELMREVHWLRRSSRQSMTFPMGGVTGRLHVSGPQEAMKNLESVLGLAQLFHVGADVAFGCGRIVFRRV